MTAESEMRELLVRLDRHIEAAGKQRGRPVPVGGDFYLGALADDEKRQALIAAAAERGASAEAVPGPTGAWTMRVTKT